MKYYDLYKVTQFIIDAGKFPLPFSNIHKIIHVNIAALVILGCAPLNGLQVHTGSKVRNPQGKGQGHPVEPILVETSISFHSCIYRSPPE